MLFTSDRGIDMVPTAAHEIGHSLGLGHSRDRNALMYAYLTSDSAKLGQDDINGIQALYGKKINLFNKLIN